MFRTEYPAVQQFFNARHPSIPFFIASFIGLLFILLPAMLRRKNHFPVKGRLVLITGGSQGLGEAMGIEFAKKGADVVLVARNVEKLKLAGQKVEAARASSEQKISFQSADLTVAEEAQKVFMSCERVPDIVICCAGAAIPGYFAEQSTEVIEYMMKTIYFTAMWTAHAAINSMIRSPLPKGAPKRHIMFTSSLLAFSVIPGYAAYSPAKAAIRMLADTLREECLLYDIDVSCNFPANILSPGYEQECKTKPELTAKLEGTAGAEKPESVAKEIIYRLERGHKHITYQFVGSLLKNMMQGMTERDSAITDFLTGIIGLIVWPFVRLSWRNDIKAYKQEHIKRELPPWP